MKSAVDATVTGATLGGALGGLFGGLHKKADQVTNEDLKTVVDGQLNLPGIESGAAPARPAAPVETPAAPVQAETLFTPEEMGAQRPDILAVREQLRETAGIPDSEVQEIGRA